MLNDNDSSDKGELDFTDNESSMYLRLILIDSYYNSKYSVPMPCHGDAGGSGNSGGEDYVRIANCE